MLSINGFSQKLISKSKSLKGSIRPLLSLLPLLVIAFLLLWRITSADSRSSLSETLDKRLAVLKSWMYQTETNGPNRSPLIDKMNRYVGSPLGSSYCAAAVCYSDSIANGKSRFRTGLARNLRNKETFSAWEVLTGKKQIKKGYVIIWQNGQTVFGHAATASEDWNGWKGKTYEGNTSPGEKGSQSNGGGFYPRVREISQTSYQRIKWITPLD